MFEVYYPPIFGLSLNSTSTFPEYARYFFNFGMAISITLATLVIVYGGIYYLISLGSGKFTDEGKAWIKAGITGLVLLLGSYLIVYTINPDLVIFRLNGLKPVIYTGPINEAPNPNTPRENYLEIPIGILTENVLAKTTDCYTFDANGNPVAFFIETKNRNPVFGPSKLDNDRTDCVLELAKASEKKSEAIKNLSDQISELMQQCSCKGKCDSKCDLKSPSACGPPETDEEGNKSCPTGQCKDKACKAPKNSSGDCCPKEAKKQIEQMLDQLRTKQSNIANLVEQDNVININGRQGAQTQKMWKDLNLIEQAMYFKEKISLMQQKIKEDLASLSSAKNVLNQCYYAMPYIDFLKFYEQTKPEEKIIQKIKNYPDSSKYCNGFSFGNSSCFNVCKNVCPGNSQKDLACYKKCNGNEACMEKCYNQRECLKNENYGNFEGCIAFCRGNCSDNCKNQFFEGSEEFISCQEKCNSNSKCLVENETKCVFNAQKLGRCAENTNNAYYLKNCMDASLLCKSGSNQNAGYPECLQYPFSTGKDYSASYIFQNPEYQVCKEPYLPYEPDADIPCIDIYPETSKCPASSNCPACPCETADGKCDEFLFNDDPLTFYCKQDLWGDGWWINAQMKKLEPIKDERFCSRENEIPLGRAVDGTEIWAGSLMEKIDAVTKNINKLIDYLKKIGQEQDYCKCNSACEQKDGKGGLPCSTDCLYNGPKTETDAEGNEITIPEKCSPEPCKGISCQKMINLLKGGKTDNCPVEKEGVGSFHDKILEASEELYGFIISGARSDLLKGLTYSRTKTGECSMIKNINGEEAKLLNCQTVKDYIVPPVVSEEVIVNEKIIKSQCYGRGLSEFGQDNLTDNWFCCEKR